MNMMTADDVARRLIATDVPEGHSMLVVGEPTFDEVGAISEVLSEACGRGPDMAFLGTDTYRVLYQQADEDPDPSVAGVPANFSDIIPRGEAYLVVMDRVLGDRVDPSGVFRIRVVG